MPPRINIKIDPCGRGHYGQWRRSKQGVKCRVCEVELHAIRQKTATARLANLRAIYEATPNAMAKAAELLHMERWRLRNYLVGTRWAPRWRVAQLKAVLELCILTNGNGRHA